MIWSTITNWNRKLRTQNEEHKFDLLYNYKFPLSISLQCIWSFEHTDISYVDIPSNVGVGVSKRYMCDIHSIGPCLSEIICVNVKKQKRKLNILSLGRRNGKIWISWKSYVTKVSGVAVSHHFLLLVREIIWITWKIDNQ